MTKRYITGLKVAKMALFEDVRGFCTRMYLRNVHTIYTLSLGDYLQVICNGKYGLLRRTTIFTPHSVLVHGLSTILDDYRQLSTNPDIKQRTGREDRLSRLYRRQLEIHCATRILCHRESIESYLLLRRHFVIDGTEDRPTTVKKALAQLKGLKMEIDTLGRQSETTHQPTMSDYLREIQILRHEGYSIDTELRLSLAEYAQIQNLAREAYEAQKQHIEQRKNGTGNH
jgi:hypothetical protein